MEPWVYESMKASAAYQGERLGFTGRVEKGLEAVRDVVGKVWPWVLAGIAVGAGIHGYVPEGLLAGFMGKSRVVVRSRRGRDRRADVLERGGDHPDGRGAAREGRRPRDACSPS